MSESHSSEQMLAESSRQMALQSWRNVCRKTFVWKERPAVELMTIAVTACCCVPWCGGSDTPALTSVVSCRSRPVCTWCVVLPMQLLQQRVGNWHEIVVAPDLRFSPRCFVLAAASQWCRMESRIAQHCSSRFWRESGYMKASVLGPVLADDICGGSLLHSNCTIAPQLTRGCRMSGDGQEWRRGLSCCPPRAGRHQQQITTSYGTPPAAGWSLP